MQQETTIEAGLVGSRGPSRPFPFSNVHRDKRVPALFVHYPMFFLSYSLSISKLSRNRLPFAGAPVDASGCKWVT